MIFQHIKNYVSKYNPKNRSELFRSSLNNAFWNSADYIVLPVLWLLSAPFFVGKLGADQFGIWMLANSIIGFSGIMGLGLTGATVKYVAKYRAIEDINGVRRIFCSTFILYSFFGVLSGGGLFLSASFFVKHVFTVDVHCQKLAIDVFRIASIGISVRLFDDIFTSLLQGFERYDLAARVSIPINIITILVNIVLVHAGLGIQAILIASIGVIGISSLLKAYICNELSPLQWQVTKDSFKEIAGFGVYNWLQTIGSVLFSQADKLIIASLIGTTALTYYTVCLQLVQQIHTFPAKAFAFLFPFASKAYESGDMVKMRTIYIQSLHFVTVLAIAVGLPIFLFANQILTLWMGAEFASNATGVLSILVISSVLLATSVVPSYYLNGSGFFRQNTVFALSSGIVVVLATLILIPWFGVIGAALGRLMVTPVGVISRSIVHYKVLQDRRWYAGILILFPILITFGLSSMAYTQTCHRFGQFHTLLLAIITVSAFGGFTAKACLKRICGIQ
jgi:O-antigen/teichoic acid export membrane protein